MGNPHQSADKHVAADKHMATEKHMAPGSGHHGSTYHEPVEVDPEHDVDGKMSAVLIVVGALVFFGCFWLLLPIFDEVMTRERDRKINSRPNLELQQLLEGTEDKTGEIPERAFLRGEGSKSKKTIEQVMAEMIK